MEYDPIYGHYKLQPYYVNDRPYFRKGGFGLWWDGFSIWVIGSHPERGQSLGYAHVQKDVFCPYQLSDLAWYLWSIFIDDWYQFSGYGGALFITCE